MTKNLLYKKYKLFIKKEKIKNLFQWEKIFKNFIP